MNTEKRILIFGGTSEGRSLSECLVLNQVHHTVCVATEYGEEVMLPSEFCTIQRGRLNPDEMTELMKSGRFSAIVDATHPYAVEVSKNVRCASQNAALPYLRYLRTADDENRNAAQENREGSEPENQTAVTERENRSGIREIRVDSAREAAEYLEQQSGVIFLTTGSKELPVFTERISDLSRLYARVLPSAEVLASCRSLGLEGKQICAMQGPFSREMNLALLRQSHASFLVTKDTGNAGGYPDKEAAARELGIPMVIIRRPKESGLDRSLLLAELGKILGISLADSEKQRQKCPDTGMDRKITCIGIGMGNSGTLTHEAAERIREADILFGADRILESVRSMNLIKSDAAVVTEYSGKKIASYLKLHSRYRRVAILMSGDVGFYSGARGIQNAFEEEVSFVCGISSVVYFASKIPSSWQDAKLLSAHGKQVNLLNHVQRYPKIILIVSGVEDVRSICTDLLEGGFEDVNVTVGTNLSYPEETVVSGKPADFINAGTTGLHIMMIEHDKAEHMVTPGIPDERFIRGKVPMTKEEIRILSVSKMQLQSNSVIYDIGAGTGSVSVECARLCSEGCVYAIERNPEGIALIRENAKQFHLSNLIPVEGLAPEVLQDLPVPTHAFIGGSSGNMREIIEVLTAKNPDIRIVINTIALESIAEVMEIMKEIPFRKTDIVQISAAKSKTLGRYHMMTGQNPIYVITLQGRE